MHIKTRNNLIEFLENHLLPNSAILRALLNHNENLGGFSQTFSLYCPGWIVRCTSKNNNVYHIIIFKQGFNYAIRWLHKVPPWKFWIGDQSKNPLYTGDKPDVYKLLRDKDLNKET